MEKIADRVAGRLNCAGGWALGLALAGCLSVAGGNACAQAPAAPTAAPAKPATFSGCVQKAPGSNDTLVISAPTACAKLTGNVQVDKLAGHQVDLTGVLTVRTDTAPASIAVNKVAKVGASCTDVCSLRPPGTRGLHPPESQEVFGTEGGTPGLTAPPK